MKVRINIKLREFITLITALFTLTISAKSFNIDGIWYSPTSSNEVGVFGSNLVTTIIPDEISYEGKEYKVTSILKFNPDDTSSPKYMWEGVRKLVLGKNIKIIRKGALFKFTSNVPNYNEYELEEIELNEGLETIEAYAFRGSKISKIIFPETLKTIGEDAFYNSMLRDVKFSSSLVSIGTRAFCHSKMRGTMHIPSSIEYIGSSAFCDTKIDTLIVEGSAKSIESGAFGGCYRLTNVTFLGDVEQLGESIFMGCDSIKKINILMELPPTCEESTWSESTYKNTTLCVPKGSKPWYYLATGWKGFKHIEEKYEIVEKCKTPTISIIDNKISITCETGDAEIHYSLKSLDDEPDCIFTESFIPTTKYVITAYAQLDEFNVSDKVSLTFTVIQETPSTIKVIKAEDANISVEDKHINIETSEKQNVEVYSSMGAKCYNGIVCGSTTIPMNKNGVYIVKVGNTINKVIIK